MGGHFLVAQHYGMSISFLKLQLTLTKADVKPGQCQQLQLHIKP